LRCRRKEEVKEDWDFFEIVGTVPAAEAYRKPEETDCSMERPV
jgi:hypothetical protein